MKGLLKFYKEIRDYRNFFNLDKKEREIVFYSEDASYFTFFEGLINHLSDNYDMKLCYVTSDYNDPMLSQNNSKIRSFYVKYLLCAFMKQIDSSLVLMTMPDLNQFHIRKSDKGINYIYLFHNIGSYFHVIRDKGLIAYDTLFCAGPHQIEEARKEEQIYELQPRKIVEFGYHRLDKIYKNYQQNKHEYERKQDYKYKAKILIAPGWGPWHERNNMLDLCGGKLIGNLLKSNCEVVLRPHPMTRIKFPKFLNSLSDQFKIYDNFILEENVSSLDSFYSSDIMISDWSGVVYEYAFGTEKPLVFIDSPMKVNNTNYVNFGIKPIDYDIRKQLGVVVKLEEMDNIGSVVDDLIRKRNEYRNNIIKIRDKYVFNLGNSSSAGAKYIYEHYKNQVSKFGSDKN